MSLHSYDPRAGHRLAHDPLKAIVGPRPIGWIGTRSRRGIRNLAPYSFFNVIHDDPPILMFCSSGAKDSVSNIEATGCFTWNLVTRDLAEAMNATAAPVPPETDEFDLAGLAGRPGEAVAADCVERAAVAMECRAISVQRLHDADGRPLESWLTLGEVVRVHIDLACLAGGTFALPSGRAQVLRGGGPTRYFAPDDTVAFDMTRPR